MNNSSNVENKLIWMMRGRNKRRVAVVIIVLMLLTDAVYLVRLLIAESGFDQLLLAFIPVFLPIEIAFIELIIIAGGAKKENQTAKEAIKAKFVPVLLLCTPWMMIAGTAAILFITYDNTLYSSLLAVLLAYCFYYSIKNLVSCIRHRGSFSKHGSKKAFFAVFAISLAINFAFAYNFGDSEVFTKVGEEYNAVDVHPVFNEDGTLKHNQDGSLVGKIEYEKTDISALRLNYFMLLYPAASIGITYAYSKARKENS